MNEVNTPNKTKHIVVAPKEYSICSGCGSCEMVCSLVHEKFVSPSTHRIYVEFAPGDSLMHTIHTCQQCDDHPCYEACPKKDKAMLIDENGIVYVNEEECVGCGLCAKACPQSPSMITIVKDKSLGKRRAIKCDLCRTRPEGPACVEYCQAMCLGVQGDEPWNK